MALTADSSDTGSDARGTDRIGVGAGETVEFGARSTADEVLRGIDLAGRLALVTGGSSGLGREATAALARAGARVVVPARRPAAARAALTGIDGVEVDELDLADLDSVRAFADRFLASGRNIDIMMTNAGIMACPQTRVGPGWEAQFGVNHLGHYALVNLLWPAIGQSGGARVVVLTSRAQHPSAIRWSDPHFTSGYDKWQAYAQSKRANVLFADRLDTLGREVGVRAFSVHPGHILTPLQRHLSRAEMVDAGWVDADGNLIDSEFKTPEQGAATQVWAATSPGLAGTGGRYCEDCAVVDHETDPDGAARLWALSAELTGVDAFRTED
ncbi:oxidoreductase [Plantactinospora sp. B6F1]|uniref:oxidoreductase n=1 Tax=Plantactinospora sp. B6F1 TaxID=3158971 RepID=UPI0032D96CCE